VYHPIGNSAISCCSRYVISRRPDRCAHFRRYGHRRQRHLPAANANRTGHLGATACATAGVAPGPLPQPRGGVPGRGARMRSRAGTRCEHDGLLPVPTGPVPGLTGRFAQPGSTGAGAGLPLSRGRAARGRTTHSQRGGRRPAGSDQSGGEGQAGQVGAAAAAGLVPDPVQVRADGADADVQLGGDLGVGAAAATRVTSSRSRALSVPGPGTAGCGGPGSVSIRAYSAALAARSKLTNNRGQNSRTKPIGLTYASRIGPAR
jgi:hypothetical protein